MTDQHETFMLEAIKVISEEARKSFTVGFDKALEMCRNFTQPLPAMHSDGLGLHLPPRESEEEDFGSPTLESLLSMPPEMRQAVAERYGFTIKSPATETDPTAQNMRETIKSDGHEPPQESEE